jgi:DNA-binding transcriptional ArsR family regulator
VSRSHATPDAVFAALADPTRRAVLALVGQRGPLSATELASELPVTRQAVVKHLGQLRDAGLVGATKVGRDVRYELRSGALEPAADWISAVGERWDRRLAALEQRARQRG